MVKLLSSHSDKLLASIGVMLFFIDQKMTVISILLFMYLNKYDIEKTKKVYTTEKLKNTLILFIIANIVIYFISISSKYLLHEFDEQNIVQYFKHNKITKLAVLNTVVIVPIIEEIVFRGLFYKLLRSYFSIVPSMLISSIIFSIVHENILVLIVLFSLGLILCYSYERNKSIIYPIVIHSLFNLLMLLLILYA